jgi:hypothetical protein
MKYSSVLCNMSRDIYLAVNKFFEKGNIHLTYGWFWSNVDPARLIRYHSLNILIIENDRNLSAISTKLQK